MATSGKKRVNGKVAYIPKNSTSDLYKGLYVEGSAGEYQKNADEIVKGARDVLNDFGYENEIKSVMFIQTRTNSKSLEDLASMNGQGDLKITKSGLEPQKNTNGYLVNDTHRGLGTHEAGHAVVYALIKDKVMPNATRLEQSTARKNQKLEKAIIKEAARRYGSNPKISKYGSTKFSEKVAEAVSDTYSNKNSANPFSKVVVGVMKDIKTGKFKPKI